MGSMGEEDSPTKLPSIPLTRVWPVWLPIRLLEPESVPEMILISSLLGALLPAIIELFIFSVE